MRLALRPALPRQTGHEATQRHPDECATSQPRSGGMIIESSVEVFENPEGAKYNEQKWVNGRFAWQEGCGAFSYGHSQIKRVYNYILNQEKHHRKRTFREEYMEFLQKFQTPYEDRFLFEWLD